MKEGVSRFVIIVFGQVFLCPVAVDLMCALSPMQNGTHRD